ncbi:flippase [Lachnospiraceae bacterium ZAX-1]
MKEKSIKHNFALNSILQIASVLFPLISFPYVSRVLLPEGTGKVTLATAVVSYFSMFAMMGIPTYGIRVCAQVRNDKVKLSKAAHEILMLNMLIATITSGVYIVTVFLNKAMYHEKVLYFICGSNLLLNVIGVNWLYSALEEYRYITVRSIAFKFVACIAMFALIQTKKDYIIYAAITTFALAGSNILNFCNAQKHIITKPFRWEEYQFKRHIKPILMFFTMTIAISIYSSLDIIMLGSMAGNEAVGYYNAAIKIQTCLWMLVTALGTVLLPRMSIYFATNEMQKIQSLERKAIYCILWLAIPLVTYFMIFSAETIQVLAGDNYQEAVLPMMILLPTVVVSGIGNNFGNQILIPSGREKWVVIATIVGAVVNGICNVVLIPVYGVSGAALATLIAVSSVTIVEYRVVKDMSKGLFLNKNNLKIVIANILAVCVMLYLKKNLYVAGLWKIAISFIASGAVYVFATLLFKEEMVISIWDQLVDKVQKRSAR